MQYAPRFAFPPLTGFVKQLIITLLAAFVIELVLMNFVGIPVFAWLALNTGDVGFQTLWQMVTYALVEDPTGVFSMLIGLLFIWLIVSPFEANFGRRRTMQLCATGVLFASIPAVVVGVLLPWLAPGPSILFGSHPIAYAGIAAMATTMRGRKLSLFGLFSMSSNQLLLLMAGLSLLVFLASKNLAMLIGSLGSIAGGVWFVNWMTRPRTRARPKSRGRGFKVISGGRADEDKPPKWLN